MVRINESPSTRITVETKLACVHAHVLGETASCTELFVAPVAR